MKDFIAVKTRVSGDVPKMSKGAGGGIELFRRTARRDPDVAFVVLRILATERRSAMHQ
jgi:hypothetical protein